ncbi:MAG: hypothetical protein WC755_01035 [Candidatus Woesearchaeota archaeon]|jgi:thiosulfate reductase cytochrome b subunit
MNHTIIKKVVAYLTLIVILLFIVTGFGITQPKIVEKLTLGLLTKSLSSSIHLYLIYPSIIFLAAHLYYSRSLFNRKKN